MQTPASWHSVAVKESRLRSPRHSVAHKVVTLVEVPHGLQPVRSHIPVALSCHI
jgi:hypothetical protein